MRRTEIDKLEKFRLNFAKLSSVAAIYPAALTKMPKYLTFVLRGTLNNLYIRKRTFKMFAHVLERVDSNDVDILVR